MSKEQAFALLERLAGAQVAATLAVSFPGDLGERWSVQLDPGAVYTGAQMRELLDYADAEGLRLSAQFSALGLV